jgi:class 3 adenylate cyclase
MAASIVCAQCGSENASSQRFCGSCGAALSQACPSCGRPNPGSFRFCGSCGAALEARTPLERPQAEERRWATVLFADLSGFTTLAERMDPEDLRAMVDRCMGLIGDIIARFGGTVTGVMGDGIMAVFGAPVAHEDDAERAVRCALELQTCAAEHAEEFGQLQLRVGVNTGELMFAPVGGGGKRELTGIGDTTNTASRLQSVAPRGGILVGAETFRGSRRAIRYEKVSPVEVKGKAEPVPAWLALEAITGPAERPVSLVPMVGRQAELDLLRRIWERTLTGRRPHLVTLLGAPGIGKTRLCREFEERVCDAGVRSLHGRSLPYGERAGYGAFGQLVKDVAGIFETDPEDVARAKLDGAVAELLRDSSVEEVSSLLAVLMGLGEVSVDDRTVLFGAARRFVEALGRQRPTVLVFDDLQWADRSLLDLVEFLASRLRDAPVLILTLARQELIDDRPAWGGGLPAYTALPLGGLSEQDIRALAMRLVSERPNAAHIVDQIEGAAGGNPLFAEELAAYVSEGGAQDLHGLPTNVTAMIGARLDALPAPERRALLDASVVGNIFWRGALERISLDREGLSRALESLESRDLIRGEPTARIPGDQEFSFKHAITREVAYGRISKALRRELHVAVAEFLEQAAGWGAAAAILAHHWREAGDSERAIEYLVQAAEQAARGWAYEEAVAFYDQALDLISEEGMRRKVRLRRAVALQARLHIVYGDVKPGEAPAGPEAV